LAWSKGHPEIIYCGILHDGLYRTADAGNTWLRIFEGDVRSGAVDPTDDRVVYVGTEPVHLYRSENGGDRWEELKSLLDLPEEVKRNWKSPQPQYHGHVRDIHIDRDNPRYLYLSIEHGGIVRSFDRGETWEDVSKGIDYLDIHKVSNDPIRKDLYFVTSARGFFRSTDPARGWTRIENNGITRDYFHDFLFLPGQPPIMLIATANGSPGHWNRPGMAQSAMFRSLDGAQTWRQVCDGLPESMDKMVWALASPQNDPVQVYAGYGQSDKGQAETRKMPTGLGAVWFSPDGGNSWREIKLGELPAVRAMWIACC
jgi:Sortilin, neurotensin receptor 3,